MTTIVVMVMVMVMVMVAVMVMVPAGTECGNQSAMERVSATAAAEPQIPDSTESPVPPVRVRIGPRLWGMRETAMLKSLGWGWGWGWGWGCS